MKKPQDLPPMSEKDIQAMADFFDKCGKLPTPPVEKVQERMRELRELGLEDIPAFKGTSSSMRQYAWTTLGREMEIENGNIPATEDTIFLTIDTQIIALADTLKAKYNVKPANAYEYMAKLVKDQGDMQTAEKLEALAGKTT